MNYRETNSHIRTIEICVVISGRFIDQQSHHYVRSLANNRGVTSIAFKSRKPCFRSIFENRIRRPTIR